MLPFSIVEDKLRVVRAIAGDDVEHLYYDCDEFSPVTRNRQTGELIMWDCHGGRPFEDVPTSIYREPRSLEEWARNMPLFFVDHDGSPILFPPRRR